MIVAEIGQNWCGDITLAYKLIALAKANGADLAKFQLYDHAKLYGDSVKDVSLSYTDALWLFEYGKMIGIEVFFSVFDVERVGWCEKIGVKRYKVAYSERQNLDLFRAIVPTRKQIIVSGGVSGGLVKSLYCVPEYPAKIEDVSFYKTCNYDGFSDHTIGLDCAKIAIARGAQIVEKHFAIDHKTGVDAVWSMTPWELKQLKEWEETCQKVLK